MIGTCGLAFLPGVLSLQPVLRARSQPLLAVVR